MTFKEELLSGEIDAELLLNAYANGIFPMAESATSDELYWIEPEFRGILPLDGFHVSKSLKKFIRKSPFEVHIDRDFEQVIKGCGSLRAGRDSSWINDKITALYSELFAKGKCHTVEVWQNDEIVGGLYGVQLGGAFFGESMFSYQPNASKVALVYLVARLNYGGFDLLDTQFVTDHLLTFGAIEISRRDYRNKLESSLKLPGDFEGLSPETPPDGILQLVNHTSNTGCSTA